MTSNGVCAIQGSCNFGALHIYNVYSVWLRVFLSLWRCMCVYFLMLCIGAVYWCCFFFFTFPNVKIFMNVINQTSTIGTNWIFWEYFTAHVSVFLWTNTNLCTIGFRFISTIYPWSAKREFLIKGTIFR